MALSKRRAMSWLNLALAGVLMFGVWGLLVVLSTRPALKVLWDWSPQARFTVSQGTEEVLANLRREGVQVEFHTLIEPTGTPQNDEQRHMIGIQQRLQQLTVDLLRQYEYLGGEAVLVKHHDVRRDLIAIRELLKGTERTHTNFVLVRIGERSKILDLWTDLGEIDNPATASSSAVPGAGNRLPVLQDYRGEEALSSAVKSLLDQGQPVVYFLTGYREAELDGTYGLGYSKLKAALLGDGFLIETLNLEVERRIPPDADMVALLEPRREMFQETAEILADYVRGGGRLFINLSYQPQPPEQNPVLEPLGRLLGFEVGTELICQLVPDNLQPGSPGRDGTGFVQNLMVQNLNPEHPITRSLRAAAGGGRIVQVLSARELRRRVDVPEDVRPDASLMRTIQWTWEEQRQLNGEVDFFAPQTAAAFGPRSVGMVIDVDAPGASNGHVVVLSGAAFINAGELYERNSDMALNIFNFLAERPVLVSVRSRAYQARDLQLVPQQLGRISWLLIGGVPISLLLLGVFVFWRRSTA